MKLIFLNYTRTNIISTSNTSNTTIINTINTIFSNKIMSATVRFTRYLYEVDEVKVSLLIALLKKDVAKAEFWMFELFYSGYVEELTQLIWKIYYDFYASLNYKYEKYLQTKMKNKIEDPSIFGSIINNFIIRPYSFDVFSVNYIDEGGADDNTCSSSACSIEDVLTTNDYLKILRYVMHSTEDPIELYTKIMEFFVNVSKVKLTVKSEVNSFKRVIKNTYTKEYIKNVLVSRVLYYLNLKDNKKKLGKNVFLELDVDIFDKYKTVDKCDKLPARKILPTVTKYPIDVDNYLSLFVLSRDDDDVDIEQLYRYDWLYYASKTPLWRERLSRYNAKINDHSKTVDFDDEDEDNLQLFYDNFGLEPDEQKLSVQQTCTQKINETREWVDLYKEFNVNGVIDILEYVDNVLKISYD